MSKTEQENRLAEKRGDHRHTLALDTEVYFHEQNVAGMFRCRTKNIGLHGAFLPSKMMPIDSSMDVELVFMARTRTTTRQYRTRQYRLRAQVVRTSDNGAGLIFPALDEDQQQDFRRFLFRAKVAARH